MNKYAQWGESWFSVLTSVWKSGLAVWGWGKFSAEKQLILVGIICCCCYFYGTEPEYRLHSHRSSARQVISAAFNVLIQVLRTSLFSLTHLPSFARYSSKFSHQPKFWNYFFHSGHIPFFHSMSSWINAHSTRRNMWCSLHYICLQETTEQVVQSGHKEFEGWISRWS